MEENGIELYLGDNGSEVKWTAEVKRFISFLEENSPGHLQYYINSSISDGKKNVRFTEAVVKTYR